MPCAPPPTCAHEGNPARIAYIEYLNGPHINRFSWDPLALLVAVRGVAGVGTVGAASATSSAVRAAGGSSSIVLKQYAK